MSDLKLPTFDNVKVLAAVVALGAGTYILYKLWVAKQSIETSIGETVDTITKPFKEAAEWVGNATSPTTKEEADRVVYDAMGNVIGYEPAPVAPVDTEDQSQAETERLLRQANQFSLGTLENSETLAQSDSPTPVGA
jgi:hypothetical protein